MICFHLRRTSLSAIRIVVSFNTYIIVNILFKNSTIDSKIAFCSLCIYLMSKVQFIINCVSNGI